MREFKLIAILLGGLLAPTLSSKSLTDLGFFAPHRSLEVKLKAQLQQDLYDYSKSSSQKSNEKRLEHSLQYTFYKNNILGLRYAYSRSEAEGLKRNQGLEAPWLGYKKRLYSSHSPQRFSWDMQLEYQPRIHEAQRATRQDSGNVLSGRHSWVLSSYFTFAQKKHQFLMGGSAQWFDRSKERNPTTQVIQIEESSWDFKPELRYRYKWNRKSFAQAQFQWLLQSQKKLRSGLIRDKATQFPRLELSLGRALSKRMLGKINAHYLYFKGIENNGTLFEESFQKHQYGISVLLKYYFQL